MWRGVPSVGAAARGGRRDVAADIVDLLSGPARSSRAGRSSPATSPSWCAPTPRAPSSARPWRGPACPAVFAGGGSVFATPSARSWLRLLEAMEQPHRSGRVRSAALLGLPRPRTRRPSTSPATSSPTSSASSCAAGPTCSPTAAWRPSSRCSPPQEGLPERVLGAARRRAGAHRPAARRPGAARRRAARVARAHRARGVAAPADRPGRRRAAPTSAAGASSPTPPPSR